MKKFTIDHLDPLGQGVFKEKDQIYFIPKTLPGEKGVFKLLKKSKGVNFGQLQSLETHSPLRQESPCPHFLQCNGCHFLHTSYSQEIDFKITAFKKLLTKLNSMSEIHTITSPKRLHYRNRIQLHYNLKTKTIGFFQYRSKNIIPVNNCLIMEPALNDYFQKFLQNWFEKAKKTPKASGHVELYLKDNKIIESWNKKYAKGGFTQVNQATNELLTQKVTKLLSHKGKTLIDLFGGQGNLSNQLPQERFCLDIYLDQKIKKPFYHLDLYQEKALNELRSLYPYKQVDVLVLDPPRSGFRQLDLWVKELQPKWILYVSCHPATMIRDLSPLMPHHQIKETYLVDLFPATYHYEAMVLLERN
ncbi:MAG: hypothetical protein QF441_02885 [Bacteriovoracaceae bacterium]|jgi:23S rRNA (uracil1939-C5)-methyltransferase|nr:hypothetical protein [Bacteriovoracaceae bacterium]